MSRWLAASEREGMAANMEVAHEIQAGARGIVSKRTGRLAGAIDASYDGTDALTGPTDAASSKNGPYGRFHELGGVHDAHNASGYMWWPTGVWSNHAAHQVKAAHPYMKPAYEAVVGGGSADRIYYDAWLRAQGAI